ncbi:DUF2497 domain-containing protein [Hyphomicrobium sp.]|uniref:DUF2497 domain-containing protein n=1 Tax=Hyphomicrobium sp. TaxID=82 RepID=UPI002E37D6FA|nr:DUF2497 domain-containing protein [Hyphomicrobium sp.]HEX2843579.1 DUF2497 domain-containing protein [Hyphomicrobium sp.]
MEEILASIRQIIADDPKAERPAPVVETSSPLPPPSPGGKVEAPKPALADRLSGVLKNGALPPTSPLGSKRPLSFDQDLADMFDEQQPNDAASAPKPDMRVASELTSTGTNGSTSPATVDAQKLTDASSVLPPPPFTPSSATSSPPFGGSSEVKSETPAPPRTFGFPPLRKQGFFPPQSTPTLPPIPSEPAFNGVAAAPASSAPSSAFASDTLDTLGGLSGLGSVVPGEIAAVKSAGNGLFGAPAFSAAAMQAPRAPEASVKASPETRVIETDAVPSLSTPASFKETAADAIGEVSKPFTSSTFETKPSPISAPTASVTDAVFEPASFANSQPIGRSEPRFAAGPGPSSTVASQALDALAQGLAASAAASAVSAATGQPAVALTPLVDPVPVARDVPASAPFPATAPQTGRTLEDAVADMLRPMLQQWVSENMPRIIERALRVEVAKTTKPGSNS